MTTDRVVAVITRTKDRALLLRRAIESVLGQTHSQWEHIIVNDGGAPTPVNELVTQYDNQYQGRVTVIHNESSLGMEAASNVGIQASTGPYITIHDDDDSWEPSFLSDCLGELDRCSIPSVKGVTAHTTQIFESIAGESVVEERRQDFDPHLVAVSLPQITEINKFMPISFLYERAVLDDIGAYDESLPVIGDWEFNIRFLMKYDVIVLKKNLANYHIRTDSASTYSNTVTAGKDSHVFYRALIVNKHMRNDISDGKISPGMLLGYGDYFYRIGGDLWRIGQVLERIKSMRIVKLIRKLTSK
ncbi:MAG: glycosyltransferase [Pseudomonadota bacterium]